MISYEDARRFRENANVPLAWDDGIPPPPCDRIEFTCLILEAAQVVGLNSLQRRSLLVDNESWKIRSAFLELSIHHPDLQFWGEKIAARDSEYENLFVRVRSRKERNFLNRRGKIRLFWKDFVSGLEGEYFEPWKTSWVFGACEDAEENVLAFLKRWIAQCKEGFSSSGTYSSAIKYPNAPEIKGAESVADYLDWIDRVSLPHDVGREVGAELPITESVQLNEWQQLAWFASVVLCFIGAIYGAIKDYYSAWLLYFIILTLFLAAQCTGFIGRYKTYWINETMTFRQWAQQIVELKKREWEILQRTYEVK